MKVKELLLFVSKDIDEYNAKLLLSTMLNVSILELGLNKDNVVNKEVVDKYLEKIQEIKDGMPIQYVIGDVNFCGNIFKVNKNVLIPRFETEELVENTLLLVKEYFDYSVDIIDLGCGSGCIGLSLKKSLASANVTLLDISDDALEVAKDNAKALSCNVNFIQSDMWNNVDEKYDVIVSNPPYIKTSEEIEDIVKNNEPHLALFAGSDGLDCYRKIREGLLSHVKDKFLLALEIGDMQKDDVINLFSDIPNIDITSKRDMQGRDRMVFIIRK